MRWIPLLAARVALAQTPAATPPVEAMREAMEKQRAAMALQREAARKQAEFASKYRWSTSITAAADCEPLAETTYLPILEAAAKRHGVALDLLKAVTRQESGFRPCAVSPKGARGLMQLMPATAERFAVRDVFDPAENVNAGARFLKELLGRFHGDVKLALGAYNAGPGNIGEDGTLPDFPETRHYVQAVMKEAGPSAGQ